MRKDMVQVLGERGRCRRGDTAPLRRFLRSQVGRPWDKVFAEISASARHGNRDLREVARRLVEIAVIVENGAVRRIDRRCDWRGEGLSPGSLYVCPRTGILRVTREQKREHKKEPKTPQPVKLDQLRECRYLDGAWHLVEVRRVPVEQPAGSRNPRETQEDLTVVRRLSKRELKQFPIPIDAWKG